ncbi:MAG: rhomboid family intramembrane serine protease [Bacteroidota bacterium]|jgi:membrane associated rhomboid family serine protease|nr:rhomboid family intramembrane serine protease [Sphingobacteriales bacterium]
MTFYIVIITCIVSILGFYNQVLTNQLIFEPYVVHKYKQWYRFFTCGLLHADFIHLAVNMFVLYSFGNAVEQYYSMAFGHPKSIFMYLLLYISSIGAANVSTYQKYLNSSNYRSLGASGAVSAIVFVFILFRPYQKIYLYGLIGLPAIVWGIVYMIYSWYMNQKATDNVNHEAHFFGAVYGMLFTIFFKPSLFLFFIKQVFWLI